MAEANWFVGSIPWALIVPRPHYVRGVKVWRHVPEVRSEVNEAAFWIAAGWVFWTVTAPLWLPFIALVLIGQWLIVRSGFRDGALPDFSAKRADAIERAWAKVPLEEIRRRIGDDEESSNG